MSSAESWYTQSAAEMLTQQRAPTFDESEDDALTQWRHEFAEHAHLADPSRPLWVYQEVAGRLPLRLAWKTLNPAAQAVAWREQPPDAEVEKFLETWRSTMNTRMPETNPEGVTFHITAPGVSDAQVERALGAVRSHFRAAEVTPYLAAYAAFLQELDEYGPALTEQQYVWADAWREGCEIALSMCYPGGRPYPEQADFSIDWPGRTA